MKPSVIVGIVVALLLSACGERDVSAADIVDDVGRREPAPCLQDGTATITAYDRDYVEPTAAQGLRRELRHNEELPAEQWIRVADDGEHVAYAPGTPDGEYELRVTVSSQSGMWGVSEIATC